MKKAIVAGLILIAAFGRAQAVEPSFEANSDQLIALQGIEAIYDIRYQLKYQSVSMKLTVDTLRESLRDSRDGLITLNVAFRSSKVNQEEIRYLASQTE